MFYNNILYIYIIIFYTISRKSQNLNFHEAIHKDQGIQKSGKNFEKTRESNYDLVQRFLKKSRSLEN